MYTGPNPNLFQVKSEAWPKKLIAEHHHHLFVGEVFELEVSQSHGDGEKFCLDVHVEVLVCKVTELNGLFVGAQYTDIPTIGTSTKVIGLNVL